MAETSFAARRWIWGAAYLVGAAGFMLIAVLPLGVDPTILPMPDLLVCLTFAWVLRRPHYLPITLVAGVFLIADLLFLRPPGLWAALVVLAVEFLRRREPGSRDQPFPLEWAVVAGTLFTITLVNWLILALLLVPQAGLGLTLLHFISTMLAYPLVILAARSVFGLRRMAPGEVDARGHRV